MDVHSSHWQADALLDDLPALELDLLAGVS